MPWLWYPDKEGQPKGELPKISTDGITTNVLVALDRLRNESLDESQGWGNNPLADKKRNDKKRDRDPTSRINTPDGTVEARYTLLRQPQQQGEGASWKVAYCLVTQEDTRIMRAFYIKSDGEMVLIPATFIVYPN
jgi:hypothetical protein